MLVLGYSIILYLFMSNFQYSMAANTPKSGNNVNNEAQTVQVTKTPDLNVPMCSIHRPGCAHWLYIDEKEKKVHTQRHYLSLKVRFKSKRNMV